MKRAWGALVGAVLAGLLLAPLGSGSARRVTPVARTSRTEAAIAARCRRAPGHGLTLANVGSHGRDQMAVGSNGLIATSSAAGHWTVRPTPVVHDLRGVVWTGTRWVVVGDVGSILSSPDERRWTVASGIPNVGLRAVAAKPGLIVGAGAGGDAVASSNGTQWSSVDSGTTAILWGGTRLGSRLLLSGKNSTVIASTNGASWSTVPTFPRPTDDQEAPQPFLWQLAARGSRLIAVGDFGAVLEGSPAGLRAVSSPTDEILRGVTFGTRAAVAVGSSGAILRQAGSGPWKLIASPTSVDLRGVTYTGSRFVAVGDESTIITSPDGTHWRIEETAMPCALLSVAHGAGRYVAVGGSGRLVTSRNGRGWRELPRPTRQDLYSIGHGPAGFIAAGARGTVLQSRDGRTWQTRHVSTILNLHAVTWTGRQYLIGGDRGLIFSSTDGRRWRRVPFLGFHSVRDFATAGGITVAAGAGTIAQRSPNGSWTLETIGFGRFQTSVAAGAGRFVIVGHNGEALVSTDGGANWTPGTTGAAVNLDRVVFAAGHFIATGEGQSLISSDGLIWRPLKLPTPYSIRSISVVRSRLIAVGDGGAILSSGDGGLRWSRQRAG